MRGVITLLLLTACYSESDAIQQLRDLNRPEPIQCLSLSQAGADVRSYACTDGEGISWVCDSSKCFRWSR